MEASPKIRGLWLAIGWLGVVIVVYLSLAPSLPEIDLEEGDKLEHLAAYAALMLWFAQARTSRAERLTTALALVVLGVLLEFAQGLTDYRTLSLWDMVANTAGVAIGWLAAPPRLPNAFNWVSALLTSRS